MIDAFTGQISMMSFRFAPQYWAQCNGQMLSSSQNQALSLLLGTTYGSDGVDTFALPDLRGTSPVGAAGSLFALGQSGGLEAVTLGEAQVPLHTHMMMMSKLPATDGDPDDGEFLAVSQNPIYAAPNAPVPLQFAPLVSSDHKQHANMQPFLVVNMCICLSGTFPSHG